MRRFVLLTYAITWIAMIAPVLFFRGIAIPPQPLVLVGALIGSVGPSLAAVILVVRDREGIASLKGAPGSSTLMRRLTIGLLALFTPALLHMVAACVAYLAGASTSVFAWGTPGTPDQIGIFIVAPLGEELGWRGYAQRRLEKSIGAVRASLIVGVAWAAWHTPMLIMQQPPLVDVAAAVIMLVAAAVVIGALFRASGGSLLVAIAVHTGAHLDNVSRLGGTSLYITAAAFVVAAVPCALWLSRTERTPPSA